MNHHLGVLGWDEATRVREIEHYQLRVQAERESQQQPDDCSADAARLGAPDLRAIEQPDRARVVRLAERREASEVKPRLED